MMIQKNNYYKLKVLKTNLMNLIKSKVYIKTTFIKDTVQTNFYTIQIIKKNLTNKKNSMKWSKVIIKKKYNN